MAVDLLIVNYNTKNLLKRLLDRLHSDYEDNVFTINIADNESTDGSIEWLQENAKVYGVNVLSFNKNIGYSAAINDLASKTSNEFLAAVNADTWFTTRHVKDMLDFFENEHVAIAGPKQMDERHRIRHGGITWGGRASGEHPVHNGWGQFDPEDKLFKQAYPCWTVSGSLYYVRREVWDTLWQHPEYQKLFPDAKGAFLPTPHFFEETFCSVWAQHLGYKVWYNGKAETAGHTWHASSDVGDASRRYFEISKDIYRQACDRLGIEHEV